MIKLLWRIVFKGPSEEKMKLVCVIKDLNIIILAIINIFFVEKKLRSVDAQQTKLLRCRITKTSSGTSKSYKIQSNLQIFFIGICSTNVNLAKFRNLRARALRKNSKIKYLRFEWFVIILPYSSPSISQE